MNEQEFQEQQEQMAAAAQLIIQGAQEAQDFKAGGEKALQGVEKALQVAEAYKTLNDKAIDRMSKRPEAIVPESVYHNIEIRAASGVMSAKCKTPTSSELVPVLRDAYREVGPEIQYTRVLKIHGKLWFWLSVPILIATGILFWSNYRQIHFGTPESWANRNYVTAVDLGETDPGNAYHQIIALYRTGQDSKAREIVLERETQAKEHGKMTKKCEKILSSYLVNVRNFKDGVVVDKWEERTERGNTSFFIVFHSPIDQITFKAHIKSNGHIAITKDDKVNSMNDAIKSSNRKIWLWIGNISSPFINSSPSLE